MTDAISETVSEKRKRGRPRVFSETEIAVAEFVADGRLTPRGLQNVAYRQRAIGALCDEPTCRWIFDAELCRRGEHRGRAPGFKQGILAELGRIPERDLLVAMAQRICEMRPATREAVRIIRHWRQIRESVLACQVVEFMEGSRTAVDVAPLYLAMDTAFEGFSSSGRPRHLAPGASRAADPYPDMGVNRGASVAEGGR